MKAICYIEPGVVEVMDVPDPKIKDPHDILVKVDYCALCGDEKRVFRGEMAGFSSQSPPHVIGHEMSGTVVKIGKSVFRKNIRVGDRVTGNYFFYCEMCHYCATGNKQMCDMAERRSFCMAEYVVWDEQQLFKVPPNVTQKEACLTEPLTACLRGIEQGNVHPGGSVAIFGAGGIGLILLQLAKLRGAGNIAIIEPNAKKRKLALELGATIVCDPYAENVFKMAALSTHARGYDTVFEASGNSEAAKPSFEIMGKCGTLIIFAIHDFGYALPLNLSQFYYKDASIRTIYTGPYHFNKALELIPSLDFSCLTRHIFHYSEVADAFCEERTKDMPRVLISF